MLFKTVNNLGSKMLKNITSNGLKLQQQNTTIFQARCQWGYVDIAFNRVDADRLQIVGPDRLCAEWILKNGCAIRTVEDQSRIIKDYNTLPSEKDSFKIKSIDATGSSIMKMGLNHLRGCHHIDTVIFHECKHLEGLDGITNVKDTLKVLEVSACDNIDDEGLKVIGELKKLDLLKMFDMRYVKNIFNIKQSLARQLPKCHMVISK